MTLEQVEGNWTITAVHLKMTARVPGISKEKFAEIAADAKANCPVSRVLKADITLDAELVDEAQAFRISSRVRLSGAP